MLTKQQQLGSFSKVNQDRRKHLIKECDRLFSLLVRKDKKCSFCGQPATDCFHIVGRDNLMLRWDFENGKPSCRRCHNYWHSSGDGLKWLEDVRNDFYGYYRASQWAIEEQPSDEWIEDKLKELKSLNDSSL
jgi:5-methylcytosine-specific restriction endonuclease McrA